LSFFCLIIFCKAHGSLPLVHVYLSEKWLEENPSFIQEKDHQAFILGSVFPDIRYMGELEDHQTHLQGVELVDVCCAGDPFDAGVKFHCYIDDLRFQYIANSTIMEHLSDLPKEHMDLFLKLLEEEIILPKVDRKKISQYFKICYEEECMIASEEQVKKWHALLQRYFQFKPSEILRLLSLFKRGILDVSPELVKLWSVALPKLAKDPQVLAYFDDLLKHIQEKVQYQRDEDRFFQGKNP
jgi:hypothetical protein